MKVKVVCSECKTVKYAEVKSLKEAKAFKKMYNASKFKCTDCYGSKADLKLGVFTPKGKRRQAKRMNFLYPWQPAPAKRLAEVIYGKTDDETEKKMEKLRQDFFKSMPKLRSFFKEIRRVDITYRNLEI